MVREQVEARGVRHPEVLAALGSVPRHEFVPTALRGHAYADRPLPLGVQQTISQPFVVARMTELALDAERRERALEIGTGSGYQAAVLAELFGTVHSVELDPELAARAGEALERLHYRNASVHCADGHLGWRLGAPWDAILVTAASDSLPPALVQQLSPGGRIVYPRRRADGSQVLCVQEAASEPAQQAREVLEVRFVPLRGPAE